MSIEKKPATFEAVVKEEVEEDDFEEFPAGAVRFSRDELLERMQARRTQEQGLGDQEVRGQEQEQEGPQSEEQAVQAQGDQEQSHCAPAGAVVPAKSEAQELQELAQAVLPSMERFLADHHQGTVSLTTKLTKGADGKTEVSWTLTKTPTKEAHGREDPAGPVITDSQASSVVVKPRRRLRVVDSDEEEEEEEDEGAAQQVTPRKKAPTPEVVTPSPAKRLRGINLNDGSDSDSEEEEEEELIETEPELTDDEEEETASVSQWSDSRADPEWIPDTQEQRDNPADFRIPRNAPRDPLDLDY